MANQIRFDVGFNINKSDLNTLTSALKNIQDELREIDLMGRTFYDGLLYTQKSVSENFDICYTEQAVYSCRKYEIFPLPFSQLRYGLHLYRPVHQQIREHKPENL